MRRQGWEPERSSVAKEFISSAYQVASLHEEFPLWLSLRACVSMIVPGLVVPYLGAILG